LALWRLIMKLISQTPTITAGAYSAGDAVGGLLTFDLKFPSIKTALIRRVEIMDDSPTPNDANLHLHLFTDPTIAVADNAALTIPKTAWLNGQYFGYIDFAANAWVSTIIQADAAAEINIVTPNLLVPPANGKIYGQLQAVATPTFDATDDLTVLMWIGEYA
jgi:hypothetical protein